MWPTDAHKDNTPLLKPKLSGRSKFTSVFLDTVKQLKHIETVGFKSEKKKLRDAR